MVPGLSDERLNWPLEATVRYPDGRIEFSAFARENPDGSVTVRYWEPEGDIEKTYPPGQVTTRLAAELEAARWYVLYEQVYGTRAK